MRRFDYSFLAKDYLPPELLNVTNAISELKTMAAVRKESYGELFTKLESIAKVQSVKGSNAIEGIITTDKRIEQIVNQNSAPLNHSEMEIAGYRDALNAVHQGYTGLKVTEEELLRLHRTMLQYTGDPLAGHYKTDDNVIMETDAYGNRRVRFAPVSAAETPKAMEQMLYAYMDARDDVSVNGLLLIPCVILDFLCIHPFRDGNGRMSRLLSLLLLYKAGFDAGKYISFEEQINKTKGAYYEALRQSSVGWHEGKNDYMPFIQNFIATLYMCYKELDKRFAVVRSKKVTKEYRIEATLLDSLLPLSKRELCELLPDVSPSTIERVVGKMVKDGVVERIGTNRSARYIKNKH